MIYRVAVIVLILLISGCESGNSSVMVASVSSDGQYAVSAHRDNQIILWDIEGQTSKSVSDNANIYSAYFVHGSSVFIWQDLSGLVSIEKITENGATKALRQFEAKDSYGQVMSSDLETHVYSDKQWRLMKGQEKLKWDGDSPGFLGIGKILNLSISPDGSRLVSFGDGSPPEQEIEASPGDAVDHERRMSRYAGTVIWDLNSVEPVAKLPGNSAKTNGTISPDGNYVVSVDENAKGFVWDARTGEEEYRLANLRFGKYIGGHDAGSAENWDDSGNHLEWPGDFPGEFRGGSKLAVKFVSDSEFVVFHTYSHYVTFYQLGDPHARKVLDLGSRPHPSTGAYLRNASIASAPEAGILVTGQQNGNGINVYQFDEETKELEKIWTPRRRSWWPF